MKKEIIKNLPDNITQCHELIIKLAEKVDLLTYRLQQITQKKYGKKTEQLDVEQLKSVFEELQQEYPDLDLTNLQKQGIEKIKKASGGGGGGRRITQDNDKVETKVIAHELNQTEIICPKCEKPRVECGKEITTELDYIPGKFVRVKHEQLKYACKGCKSEIVTAPKPDVPAIEKGAPSFSLLSNIITNKYADHLPLYRQEQIFERMGIHIPRSSMCRWLALTAEKLEPIYSLIIEEILKSKVVQADETPLKYLKPNAGKAKLGYVWTFLGDGCHNYVAYSFCTNRSGDNPNEFLQNYSGYLQTDAYTGYNKIAQKEGIKPLGCMAHARRKFVEAEKNNKVPANYAILEFSKLYEIEKRIKDLSDNEKYQIRQQEALPILSKLKDWLIKIKPKYLPNEPIGIAINYMSNNFDKLTVYLEHGYLSIDNNPAERNIRPIAIGRKNWMFLGNDGAGKTFSILSTLVNCCKMNQINVFEYIKDVLEKLTINSNSNLFDLLPVNWQKNCEKQN